MNNKLLIILLSVVQINFVLCRDYQPYRDLSVNYESYNEEAISSYDTVEVEKDKVTFRLWTSLEQKEYIHLVSGQLSNITVKADKPFKFITHGYLSGGAKPWVRDITNAYLSSADLNVVEVDWSEPASTIMYPNAAAATKSVGKHLADLIIDLHQQFEIPFASFHLIGHSLGAHVSGFAGKGVQVESGESLGRISGLDPAGPLFLETGSADRLASTDANFVDVIHTDGKKYGYYDSLGNVDFYPNGGVAWQPGCYIYGVVELVACSHVRVCKLWLESIQSDKFIANVCKDINSYNKGLCKDNEAAIMGENADTKLEGKFYLNTKSASPFAKDGDI